VLIGPGLSSFIEPGGADVVLGLEPLEVLRARIEMSARTKVIINTDLIPSTTSPRNGHLDPDVPSILVDVRAVAPDVVTVDGTRLVEEAGGPQALNIAMLGVLAGLRVLPIDGKSLWKAVESRCPERFLEANRRAFARGEEVTRA
jgi:indolepyruvate ferredoxin oxidoreductase beta subunit